MTAYAPGSRRTAPQTRRVRYRWRLREVMALHGLFMTTDLAPLLASRGINLSPSQIHRIVVGTPERLSMPVLAALCDIFQTDPNDFIVIDSQSATATRTGEATDTDIGAETGIDLAARRPTRARITTAPPPTLRARAGSGPGPGPGPVPGPASR
jgi:DNA-binding Xre family transcriptional regulator